MDSACKAIQLKFVFIWIGLVILRNTDGSSVTWYEPPPVVTTSITGDLSSDSQQLLEGSSAQLSWNFSLTAELNLILVTLSSNDVAMATIVPSTGQAGVEAAFVGRVNVTWISNKATLIIFNVTAGYNGEFACELTSFEGATSKVWVRKIPVKVVDPAKITDISGNLTLNENDEVILNCTADGAPKPENITRWTRVPENSPVNFTFTITGKQDEGLYRCTADNGIGNADFRDIFITVQNYRPINVNLTTDLSDNSVHVNTAFNITCIAQANPPAKYRFYKDQDNLFTDTTGSDVSVITDSVSERVKQVNYSCTPFNDFGDGETKVISLMVLYAPGMTTLTTSPSNTTLLRGTVMSLNCETDASPEAEYYFFFNGNSIGNNRSGELSITVENDGVYTCVPINTVGTGHNASITITAVVAPTAEVTPQTSIINEGGNINLTCNASGDPTPSIHWNEVGSSEVLSNTSSLSIVNVSRPGTPDHMIQYQCTASNGVEKPATATATINVHYPASITNQGNETSYVEPGQNVNFLCLKDGNPTPTTKWTSEDGDKNLISWDNLNNVSFTAKANSSGLYLCTVENYLRKDLKWFHLLIETQTVLIKITVTNKGCNDKPQDVSEQLRTQVREQLKSQEPFNIEQKSYECGSVTVVYFLLKFEQKVAIPEILSLLKKAAESQGFGDLEVDSGSIQAISDDQVPTEPSTQGTPKTVKTESPCTDSFVQEANCNLKTSFIIVIVVVGVIVISVIIAIVVWWVHKRRKCRKHNEVGSTPSEERPFSRENSTPADENAYSQVNNGYAEKGPSSTEMTEMSQHQGASSPAAVPEYAVVDKKGKKNSAQAAEQKPAAEPEYAQVDKSKKKKKDEPDATYAQVDMSKKTRKKKAKPGEVLYADLSEFTQNREMPEVSTSPQPLPPIKKPTPYVETQYADITQFLKGDATLPASEDSQDPATGPKEDAPAANTGEAEKTNGETSF